MLMNMIKVGGYPSVLYFLSILCVFLHNKDFNSGCSSMMSKAVLTVSL